MPTPRARWRDPRSIDALLPYRCRPEVALRWGAPAASDLASAIRRALPAWLPSRPDVLATVEAHLSGPCEVPPHLAGELVEKGLAWREGRELRLCWELVAAAGPHLDFVPPLLSVLLGRTADETLVHTCRRAGFGTTEPPEARDRLYRGLRNPETCANLLARAPRTTRELVFALVDRHGAPLPEDAPGAAEGRELGLLLDYDAGAVTLPLETGLAVNVVRCDRLEVLEREHLHRAACARGRPIRLDVLDDLAPVLLAWLVGPADPTRGTAAEVFGIAPALVLQSQVDHLFGPRSPPPGVPEGGLAWARDLADRAQRWLRAFQHRLLDALAATPDGDAVRIDGVADLAGAIAARVAAEGYADREDLVVHGSPMCWRSAAELLARPPRRALRAHVLAVVERALRPVGLAARRGGRVQIHAQALRWARRVSEERPSVA